MLLRSLLWFPPAPLGFLQPAPASLPYRRQRPVPLLRILLHIPLRQVPLQVLLPLQCQRYPYQQVPALALLQKLPQELLLFHRLHLQSLPALQLHL